MPRKTTTATVEPALTPDIISAAASSLTPTPQLPDPREPDEFSAPEFLDPKGRLPRIQALRGNRPENCGYFIAVDQLAKSGWLDFDAIADQLIAYTFESSGETEQGLLMQHPRMLVCPRTPLLGYDRAASRESEQLTILGHWQRDFKGDDNIGNCQMYEIILLSSQNEPLHNVPFSYVAKGANQATFSQEWQKLVDEVTTCHAISNAIAARPKNAKFKSLCVFDFQTGRELVGQKQKSWACRVTGHEVPNLGNWQDFFVGYDPSLKQQIWAGLQPELPLIAPGATTETLMLPASLEE
jgi:hypothetical protein